MTEPGNSKLSAACGYIGSRGAWTPKLGTRCSPETSDACSNVKRRAEECRGRIPERPGRRGRRFPGRAASGRLADEWLVFMDQSETETNMSKPVKTPKLYPAR